MENMGRLTAMGSAIEAVSVPCVFGAVVDVEGVVVVANNPPPRPPVAVLIGPVAGFPKTEVLILDGWLVVLCPRVWPKKLVAGLVAVLVCPRPNNPVPVVPAGLAELNRPPVVEGCWGWFCCVFPNKPVPVLWVLLKRPPEG